MNDNSSFIDQSKLIELITGMPNGVGIYNVYQDASFEMVYLNDGYYDIIGASRDQRKQYMGFSAIEAVPKEYREMVVDEIKKSIQGLSKFEVRIPSFGVDGKERWLQLSGKIVERVEDHFVAYVNYTDVTEFEKNSRVLERANKEIKIAAEKGGILYWLYNVKKHQTIITNGKGYGYDKIIENVPEVFKGTGDIHKDDEELYFHLFEEMQEGVEFCECYARIFNHLIGEYQWQRVMFTKYTEDEYIGSSIEVTEHKRMEQRYCDEIAVRNDMLKDCILFFQVNLSQNVIEEKITTYPEFQNISAPYEIKQEYWNAQNEILPDKNYYKKLMQTFSTDALLKAWEEGKTYIELPPYQMRLSNLLRMVKTTASLMKKPGTSEIIALSYTKDVTDVELRKMISNKLFTAQYDAIDVIDCRTSKYSVLSFSYDETAVERLYSQDYNSGVIKFSEKYIFSADRAYYQEKATIKNIREQLDKSGKYSVSFRLISQTNENPVKKMTYLYLDSKHHAILSVLEDVTEVTKKEKAYIKELHATLEKAEVATKSKTEFLSRMSHDMRTPMNGILGLAELSKDETNPNVLRENIRKIKDSGEYLLGLINDTLDFQKIESGKLTIESEVINANDVLQGILEIIVPAAKEKNIDFRVKNANADMDWYVRTDALRIKQIFVNLLSNAVKFTPEGGTIEFEFELLKRDGMISYDKIYIRDTGIGMSEDFIKNKLFQPFSQESNEVTSMYAGSGLGLSIVKNLVELMGGRIEVKSELGEGTTFILYMNFERVSKEADIKQVKDASIVEDSSYAVLAGKKILLAEDHPLNAEIVKRLLDKVGCKVVWTKDGNEVVAAFDSSNIHEYDIILMDIRMPNKDGLEATRCIRNMNRDDAKCIPIIAMTANAFSDDIKYSKKAGMNVHLAKPIDVDVMYQTMIDLLS